MPRLRIVSYNIQALLQGADGVIETLARLAPDLVGLQEVDLNTKRSGHVDQARRLARALDLQFAYAAAMPFDGGEFGLAILGRGPLSPPRFLKLPRGGQEEPRIAMFATCDLSDGTRVRLVNTHLAADWRANHPERIRSTQAAALVEVLAEESTTSNVPLFVVGDFNCDASADAYSTLCTIARPLHAEIATHPATAPRLALDHAFFVSTSREDGMQVEVLSAQADASTASDHCALVVDVELDAASPADA